MSNLDFSKPRQTYKELFGVDMPKEVEAVIAKLCLLFNTRPDNIEITHFLINGWLNAKMKEIPAATVAATKQTGEAIAATLTAAGNEFINRATEEAGKAADLRFSNAREEFTHYATAEIKRLAAEAKNLAPAQYQMWASLAIGTAVLVALLGGFTAGWWGQRWHISADAEKTDSNTYVFPPSLNLRMHGGTPVSAIKITGVNRAILIPGKGEVPEAGAGEPAKEEKKGLFSWLFGKGK